jgi:acetolactate synthase-1/2/3 large subunit
VTTIFSLSGNQIMPLYDACIDANVRIVHVRHEAAAVFMADAWAQVTGEIGVAMLTAGPGVSNGIAPLYSALQAESPVLLLSGDSPLQEDGTGSFQELDLVSMTTPLTKLSQRVMGVGQLVGAVDHAISTALAAKSVSPTATIYCEAGNMAIDNIVIHDTHVNKWLTPTQILSVSSNIGTAKIALGLGEQRLYEGRSRSALGSGRDGDGGVRPRHQRDVAPARDGDVGDREQWPPS